MDLRQDAVEAFRRNEGNRLIDWESWGNRTNAIVGSVRRGAGVRGNVDFELRTPVDAGLDVELEWHTTGAVVSFDGDDMEFYGRLIADNDDAPPEVEAYPVGQCPRCGHKVPLGPAVTSQSNLGAVLVTGRPVGHDCPETWTP